MDIVVAEKNLVAESDDGARIPIKVTIGRPVCVGNQTWTCPIEVDGLGRVSDGLGTDSWNALTVAIGVVRQKLSDVAEEARLTCSTDGVEIDIDDLFPEF